MKLEHLKGDLAGGFVAGVIALPLALAFGVQSGLGAAAGLYGAIAVGIFAAALGGTRTQASGPTGPMTVVSATIVAYAIEKTGSIEAGMGIIALSFFLGGLFQVLLGALRVGKNVKYFPYPVVSGFMSGVGLIIIFLQLWPLLGSPSPKSTFEVFSRIGEPLANINWAAVGLGVLTLVTYYVFPLITKKVPAVLVALIVGSLAALGLEAATGIAVPKIGEIPSGLPDLHIDAVFAIDPAHIRFAVESGMTLALLGSVDSLLTSVIADNVTKDRHDSNRELFGQGVGNMLAAMVGGIPGAGATKGTVVNIEAGGKTRLSGVTHGVLQLIVLLGAGGIAGEIPLCVLAGLLISVGVAILDTRGFKHLRSVPKADSFVMLVVLGWTVFGNLIHAVAIGLVLASILFMKKMSDVSESRSRVDKLADHPELPPEPLWDDESDLAGLAGVYVKHIDGPLFFGFSSGFRDLASQLPETVRTLVVRMDRVPYVDQSGLYALEESILDLQQREVDVLLVGVQEHPHERLEAIELIGGLVPDERVFDTVAECVAWIRAAKAPTAAA